MYANINNKEVKALTIDVDWAPECAINYVIDLLVERQVKCTWFITHDSPSLKRLRKHSELFELGIHPNFQKHSTHGNSIKNVLEHCMKLVPEAISMRTHGLFTSSNIFGQVIQYTPIKFDISTFLPGTPYLRPCYLEWSGGGLWKIPYFWEDDFEFSRKNPCWDFQTHLTGKPGLAIFNFHPIHIFLNTKSLYQYECNKTIFLGINDIKAQRFFKNNKHETGTKTLFLKIIKQISNKKSANISELIDKM